MIDELLAKEIFNYIYTKKLNNIYEIIPFKEVGEIDEIQWNKLLKSFQDADEIIAHIISEYRHYTMHVYKNIRKIPSGLKRLGHILEINNKECSFFCGREIEIDKMNVILHKKIKNNILLIGEPGVGKTSLVYAFAQKYQVKNLFVVECAKLISNTEFRGSFESKVVELMDFARGMNLILFFDEVHVLMELGKTIGGISITDILKPYLLDQSIHFIGATTLKEASLLMKDEAFKRRFTSIILGEPSEEVLLSIKEKFESDVLQEQILNRENALFVINALREQVNDQYFPDKFLDFLDYMFAMECSGNCKYEYDILLEQYIFDHNNEISSLVFKME